jgi:hypothetical protein
MLAIFTKFILPAFQFIIAPLLSYLAKRKVDADASKAKSLEKSLESVEASLKVEREIKDKQESIKKDDIVTADGSLDFSKFNEGK